MIRFIFYSWNSIDGIEEKLNNMETEGYRVERVYFNYIFSFIPKKNASRGHATYMINSNHKDVIDWRLYELEYYLTRYYRMNIVPTKWSDICLWRIGKIVEDEDSLLNMADLRYSFFIRDRLVKDIPLEMTILLISLMMSIFVMKNEIISIVIGILLGGRFVWNAFKLFDLVKKRNHIRRRMDK